MFRESTNNTLRTEEFNRKLQFTTSLNLPIRLLYCKTHDELFEFFSSHKLTRELLLEQEYLTQRNDIYNLLTLYSNQLHQLSSFHLHLELFHGFFCLLSISKFLSMCVREVVSCSYSSYHLPPFFLTNFSVTS